MFPFLQLSSPYYLGTLCYILLLVPTVSFPRAFFYTTGGGRENESLRHLAAPMRFVASLVVLLSPCCVCFPAVIWRVSTTQRLPVSPDVAQWLANSDEALPCVIEARESISRSDCAPRTRGVNVRGYVDTWIRGYVDTGSTPKEGSFLERTSRAARDHAGPGRSDDTLSLALYHTKDPRCWLLACCETKQPTGKSVLNAWIGTFTLSEHVQ